MVVVLYIVVLLMSLLLSLRALMLSLIGGLPAVAGTALCLLLLYVVAAVVARRQAVKGKRIMALLALMAPALLLPVVELVFSAGRGIVALATAPTIAECAGTGAVFFKTPATPATSVAFDWPARVRREMHTRYQLDALGRLDYGGGFSKYPALLDKLTFYETRSTWARPGEPELYRHSPSGAVPVATFSADILVSDAIANPEEMDKPVLQQAMIRHTLTATDTRNGDKLATMVYWVDWSRRRVCGANVKGAIEIDTFALQAAGIVR